MSVVAFQHFDLHSTSKLKNDFLTYRIAPVYVYDIRQGWIHPVRLGGAISVIFGSQIPSQVNYCKRDGEYFTILL